MNDYYSRGWNDGVRQSVGILQSKADELRATGNFTSDMMARIFEEQAAAIAVLLRTES